MFKIFQQATCTILLALLGTQSIAATADILFVIDDSGSMSNYQVALAKQAPTYANEILARGDDVNVAVVTTTMESWPGRTCCGLFHGKVTNSKSPSFAADMTSLFAVGVEGDGTEKPIDAAKAAFENMLTRPENSGFLRPGSTVKVIFVTDAFDQSTATPNELLRTLDSVVGPGRYVISGAVIPAAVTAPACKRDFEGGANDLIESLASTTSGTIVDLCNLDFAEAVGRLL